MTEIPHGAIAAELQSARRHHQTTVRPPSERFAGFTIEDALEVSRHHVDALESCGEQIGGLKIGLTYEPTWERVGATAPFGAPMPAAGVREAGAVSLGELASGRIEPEVLVWLSSPIEPGATLDEVRAAVGAVALGFELVDSHYPGWKATPPDLLADFGCHAGLVTGSQLHAAAAELDGLAALTVRLLLDGQEEQIGRGSDVLGGPLESIVRMQGSAAATRLFAGHVVATGSLTGRSHPIDAGQRWTVEVVDGPPLASVTLEVR